MHQGQRPSARLSDSARTPKQECRPKNAANVFVSKAPQSIPVTSLDSLGFKKLARGDSLPFPDYVSEESPASDDDEDTLVEHMAAAA